MSDDKHWIALDWYTKALAIVLIARLSEEYDGSYDPASAGIVLAAMIGMIWWILLAQSGGSGGSFS